MKKQALLLTAQNEQLKSELSLLKTQVNQHFLFNTLNNLYGLILQNQTEQAAEITMKLSDLMRYLSDNISSEKVSLKKEIQFIEDYISLEKIRLTAHANVRFTVSGLKEDIYVSPLLFIPLVENAFKHGFQLLSEENFAHFSLTVQGNDLFFEVRNLIVQTDYKNQDNKGTGLANLRKRLHLLYPKRHLLEVDHTDCIYNVTLHLSTSSFYSIEKL